MGISFLVPAFLAGLLALAIPIWVHLRNRPRQETFEFPSLMFLQQIPYRAVQRQQLRHRALFALRCLALALLTVAFARPFFATLDLDTAAASGARETVIVLDRSWSMGYGDRWSAALAGARAAVAGLAPGDRATLVAFDTEAEVLVRSSEGSREVLAALETLRPGEGTTDLASGLRAAREVLASSSLPAKEVMLISDFQRPGWSAGGDVEMPEGTRLRPVSVAADPPSNVSVAVAAIEHPPGLDGGPARIVVAARVARQGEGATEIPVRLQIEDRVVQEVTVRLAGGDAGRVRFDPVEVAEGGVRGSVRVPADALPGDDVFRFTVSPGQALSVLVLQNPRGEPNDSLFLERALRIGSNPPFRLESAVLTDLSAEVLRERDLVVLNDVGGIDAGSAAALDAFVRSGGGLLVAVGELSDDLGGLAGEGQLLPFRVAGTVDRSADLGATLGYADPAYPVFEIFAAPGSGDLSTARFFRYRALEPRPASGVVARFDDGAPALVELSAGEGRVLVWTSTLDTFWTDLPLQPVYLPFVHQLARRAADFRDPRPWLTASSPLGIADVLASAGAGGDATRIRELAIDGVAVPPEGGVRLTAGFHEVAWRGARAGAGALAANLERTESDLGTVDPEEVAASVVWRGGGAVESPEDAAVPVAQIERAQSVWWYLVVLAFALLAAETALSNRLSSRAS